MQMISWEEFAIIGWKEDADILKNSVDLDRTNMKEIVYTSKEDEVKEHIKQSHAKV